MVQQFNAVGETPKSFYVIIKERRQTAEKALSEYKRQRSELQSKIDAAEEEVTTWRNAERLEIGRHTKAVAYNSAVIVQDRPPMIIGDSGENGRPLSAPGPMGELSSLVDELVKSAAGTRSNKLVKLTKSLSPQSDRVLAAISNYHDPISTLEIAELIGESHRKVTSATNRLKDKGEIKKVGVKNGGYYLWQVVEKKEE